MAQEILFESMLFGTPSITLPTDHIKSRLVLGAYKQMEIKDPPIAKDIPNYVDLALTMQIEMILVNLKINTEKPLKKSYLIQ